MRSTKDHDYRAGIVEQPDGSYKDDGDNIYWYNEDGEYHREDGPAVILPNDIYWYINGYSYTFDWWCIESNKSDEDKMMLRLRYE